MVKFCGCVNDSELIKKERNSMLYDYDPIHATKNDVDFIQKQNKESILIAHDDLVSLLDPTLPLSVNFTIDPCSLPTDSAKTMKEMIKQFFNRIINIQYKLKMIQDLMQQEKEICHFVDADFAKTYQDFFANPNYQDDLKAQILSLPVLLFFKMLYSSKIYNETFLWKPHVVIKAIYYAASRKVQTMASRVANVKLLWEKLNKKTKLDLNDTLTDAHNSILLSKTMKKAFEHDDTKLAEYLNTHMKIPYCFDYLAKHDCPNIMKFLHEHQIPPPRNVLTLCALLSAPHVFKYDVVYKWLEVAHDLPNVEIFTQHAREILTAVLKSGIQNALLLCIPLCGISKGSGFHIDSQDIYVNSTAAINALQRIGITADLTVARTWSASAVHTIFKNRTWESFDAKDKSFIVLDAIRQKSSVFVSHLGAFKFLKELGNEQTVALLFQNNDLIESLSELIVTCFNQLSLHFLEGAEFLAPLWKAFVQCDATTLSDQPIKQFEKLLTTFKQSHPLAFKMMLSPEIFEFAFLKRSNRFIRLYLQHGMFWPSRINLGFTKPNTHILYMESLRFNLFSDVKIPHYSLKFVNSEFLFERTSQ